MSDEDRTRLRQLQDRWLAKAVIRNQIRLFGEGTQIAGPGSPTFRQVRETLLPEWEEWFSDFFV